MGTRTADLTPQIDGIKTVFLLPDPYVADSVQVHLDGILQLPGTYFVETPPLSITVATPPTVGQELQVQYEVIGTYPAPSEGYCTIAQLREEGLTTTMAADAVLTRKIALATAYIDKATGRFFEPRTMEYHLDGRGRRMLLLDEPIIYIAAVELSSDLYGGTPVDASYYKVYNRHLTEGLTHPDDRENPKIELIQVDETYYNYVPVFGAGLNWPIGTQNIKVNGIFGYTDPDGTAYGKTPDAIVEACKMLVIRNHAKLADPSRDEWTRRAMITSERTRDQSISLADPGSRGMATRFTGDPEIDQILAAYSRPPVMGAV